MLRWREPLTEYMLMSEPVFERIDEEVRPFGRAATEDLEGLGTVKTYYVDLDPHGRAGTADPGGSRCNVGGLS